MNLDVHTVGKLPVTKVWTYPTCDVLEKTHLIYRDQSRAATAWDGRRGATGWMGHRGTLGAMEMPCVLIVVPVTWVCTFVKI